MERMGVDDLLDSAVDAGAWDDGLREQSRLLYHLLVQLLRGKAAAVARSERGGHVDSPEGGGRT